MIGPFFTPQSTYLNIAFGKEVLHGNVAFSVAVFSSEKWYSSFLKKVLVFQKTCFKIKVLKTLKISSNFYIKIYGVPYHIKTSPLANQWTGSYMIGTSVSKTSVIITL